jgi:XTP/dITP diphosphohydrolase
VNRLVVATTNKGKVAELTPLLLSLGYEVCGLDAFPDVQEAVEDGATFEENALKKARHYATVTGLDVLADDSGLCVDALDGAPGVYSARFASFDPETGAETGTVTGSGENNTDADNNRALLERLEKAEDRSAHFACVLCLVRHGKHIALVEGRCVGRIAEAPRGSNGFGYDPLFISDDPSAEGRTFGESSPEVKRRLSHRAAALTGLASLLQREAADADSGAAS